VTGIQLEAGSQASDFEFLPTDVNLHRCQRYFCLNAWGGGHSTSTTAFHSFVPTRIKMRSTPSVSTFVTADRIADAGVSTRNITSLSSVFASNTNGANIQVNMSTSTSGKFHMLYGDSLQMNAEL